MNKNKENAQADWTDMIIKSWTWAKLTNEEKNKFGDELNKEVTQKIISGTYKQRVAILSTLYSMFLEGCGYNGGNWRD
ncbi:hypothetical protein [Intestinibacter sp.]|uniref:hypothetical protein n=1 Tax=Intestinibacter sp. TaxID=1965304 RepID=UPI002A74D66B|nr:hypothetical protein [Intestinibacter sp.]MDY2736882.1 hypothetical protein [Intestinibacter sp.]